MEPHRSALPRERRAKRLTFVFREKSQPRDTALRRSARRHGFVNRIALRDVGGTASISLSQAERTESAATLGSITEPTQSDDGPSLH